MGKERKKKKGKMRRGEKKGELAVNSYAKDEDEKVLNGNLMEICFFTPCWRRDRFTEYEREELVGAD